MLQLAVSRVRMYSVLIKASLDCLVRFHRNIEGNAFCPDLVCYYSWLSKLMHRLVLTHAVIHPCSEELACPQYCIIKSRADSTCNQATPAVCRFTQRHTPYLYMLLPLQHLAVTVQCGLRAASSTPICWPSHLMSATFIVHSSGEYFGLQAGCPGDQIPRHSLQSSVNHGALEGILSYLTEVWLATLNGIIYLQGLCTSINVMDSSCPSNNTAFYKNYR